MDRSVVRSYLEHAGLLFVLLLLTALGWQLAAACSMPDGWRPLSHLEKVLQAREVLYGRVRRVFPDERFNYGSKTTAYTAELEVYCIMKGQRTDSVVNITEAGHVPGMCHATNLTVGRQYVLLAGLDDNVYRPTATEIEATDNKLRELATACGLQKVYPYGTDESTATVKCPSPAPADQCTNSQDIVTASQQPGPAEYDSYDDTGEDVAKTEETSKNKPHAEPSTENAAGSNLSICSTLSLIITTTYTLNRLAVVL